MKHDAHKVKHHKHRYRERNIDVSGSKCIAQASYDPRSKELTLTFLKGGDTYVYEDVTRGQAKDLRDADSPGAVFNYEIRE